MLQIQRETIMSGGERFLVPHRLFVNSKEVKPKTKREAMEFIKEIEDKQTINYGGRLIVTGH